MKVPYLRPLDLILQHLTLNVNFDQQGHQIVRNKSRVWPRQNNRHFRILQQSAQLRVEVGLIYENDIYVLKEEQFVEFSFRLVATLTESCATLSSIENLSAKSLCWAFDWGWYDLESQVHLSFQLIDNVVANEKTISHNDQNFRLVFVNGILAKGSKLLLGLALFEILHHSQVNMRQKQLLFALIIRNSTICEC